MPVLHFSPESILCFTKTALGHPHFSSFGDLKHLGPRVFHTPMWYQSQAVPGLTEGQGHICTLQHGQVWDGKRPKKCHPTKSTASTQPLPPPGLLPSPQAGSSQLRQKPKAASQWFAQQTEPKHSAKGAEAQLISKALSTGYVLMSLGNMFKCDKPPRKDLKCGL